MADDGVIYCKSEAKAKLMLWKLTEKCNRCRLELYPEKTQIVYC